MAGTETALSFANSGGDDASLVKLRVDGLEIRTVEERPADSSGKIKLGAGTETTLVGSQASGGSSPQPGCDNC